MGQHLEHTPGETREFTTRPSFQSSHSFGEIICYSSPYGMLVS